MLDHLSKIAHNRFSLDCMYTLANTFPYTPDGRPLIGAGKEVLKGWGELPVKSSPKVKSRDWRTTVKTILRIVVHLFVMWAIFVKTSLPEVTLLVAPALDFFASKLISTVRARRAEASKDMVTAELRLNTADCSRAEAKARAKSFAKNLASWGFKVTKCKPSVIRYTASANTFRIHRFVEPVLLSTITSDLNPYTEVVVTEVQKKDDFDKGVQKLKSLEPTFRPKEVEEAYPDSSISCSLDTADSLESSPTGFQPISFGSEDTPKLIKEILELNSPGNYPHTEAYFEPHSDNLLDALLGTDEEYFTDDESFEDSVPELIKGTCLVKELSPRSIGFVYPWDLEINRKDDEIYIRRDCKVSPEETSSRFVELYRLEDGIFTVDVERGKSIKLSKLPLNTEDYVRISPSAVFESSLI